MNKKSIFSVIISQTIFIILVWWVAVHQSDVYRPVRFSSQTWLENVQQVVHAPHTLPLISWKGAKENVQTQKRQSFLPVCLSRPFQLLFVSHLRSYISANLNIVVHWRKSDLLFPFHYDW